MALETEDGKAIRSVGERSREEGNTFVGAVGEPSFFLIFFYFNKNSNKFYIFLHFL